MRQVDEQLDNGRYTVRRVLGQGGFGITYLAHDPALDRLVAIKELLRVDVQTGTAERFRREGRAVARLDHPNIVRIHTNFEQDGSLFLVSELVEGPTFQQLLDDTTKLPLETCRTLFAGIADALAAVHDAGLLHRDVKPGNIIDHPRRGPVLIDFGAARAEASDVSTQLSAILTPSYAPPEQFESFGRIGPSADVYSLAATVVHCLTGKRPPTAIARLLEDRLPRLFEADDFGLAAGEIDLLLRCMALYAEERPANGAELVRAIAAERGSETAGGVAERAPEVPAPTTRQLGRFSPGQVAATSATPERATPERATPERATPEPATPEPATPEPATPEPATPEPATPEPATPEPATPEPATDLDRTNLTRQGTSSLERPDAVPYGKRNRRRFGAVAAAVMVVAAIALVGLAVRGGDPQAQDPSGAPTTAPTTSSVPGPSTPTETGTFERPVPYGQTGVAGSLGDRFQLRVTQVNFAAGDEVVQRWPFAPPPPAGFEYVLVGVEVAGVDVSSVDVTGVDVTGVEVTGRVDGLDGTGHVWYTIDGSGSSYASGSGCGGASDFDVTKSLRSGSAFTGEHCFEVPTGSVPSLRLKVEGFGQYADQYLALR